MVVACFPASKIWCSRDVELMNFAGEESGRDPNSLRFVHGYSRRHSTKRNVGINVSSANHFPYVVTVFASVVFESRLS